MRQGGRIDNLKVRMIELATIILFLSLTGCGAFQSSNDDSYQIQSQQPGLSVGEETVRMDLVDSQLMAAGARVVRLNNELAGDWIRLPSGARAYVNEAGEFAYQPRGLLANLSAGESVQETFNFSIVFENGTTGNVEVSITVRKDGESPDDMNGDNFEIIDDTIENPVIDDPVMDEPVVDEPDVENPVVEEPVVEEPVIDEPIVDGPIVDEPSTEPGMDTGMDILDGVLRMLSKKPFML